MRAQGCFVPSDDRPDWDRSIPRAARERSRRCHGQDGGWQQARVASFRQLLRLIVQRQRARFPARCPLSTRKAKLHCLPDSTCGQGSRFQGPIGMGSRADCSSAARQCRNRSSEPTFPTPRSQNSPLQFQKLFSVGNPTSCWPFQASRRSTLSCNDSDGVVKKLLRRCATGHAEVVV